MTNELDKIKGQSNPDLFKMAQILLEAKDYRLAKNIYKHLIQSGYELGKCYYDLSCIYEQESKFDLFEKSLKEAIIYEPSYQSMTKLALHYLENNSETKAIKTLLRTSNIKNLDADRKFYLHIQLGNSYLRLKEEDNAEIHYRKAYSINPNDYSLHISIAALAFQKNKSDIALLHYKQACTLKPDCAEAYIGCGLVQMQNNDYRSAIDSFSTALEKDRSNILAVLNIAKISFKLKDYENAERAIITYTKSNPININLLYTLANIFVEQEKFREAEITCKQILHLRPDDDLANSLLKNLKGDIRAEI